MKWRTLPDSGLWLSRIVCLFPSLRLLYHCENRKTSNYWITLSEKTNVYRGNRGLRWSAGGPNEHLKERCSPCREYLSSLVFVILMVSTYCKLTIQIVVPQYYWILKFDNHLYRMRTKRWSITESSNKLESPFDCHDCVQVGGACYSYPAVLQVQWNAHTMTINLNNLTRMHCC